MPATCPCSGGPLESTEVQLLVILAAGLLGWCAFRPGGWVKGATFLFHMGVLKKHAAPACVLGAAGLLVWLGITLVHGPAEDTGVNLAIPVESTPSEALPVVSSPTASNPVDPSAEGAEPSKVIAYYFHRTVRCQSCLDIEDLAWQAIQAGFIEALGEGRLEWRPVNFEQPENAHFERDFELTTPSLILARVRNGETIDWKNLTDVWKLLDSPSELERHVRDEVARRLADS